MNAHRSIYRKMVIKNTYILYIISKLDEIYLFPPKMTRSPQYNGTFT